MAILSTSEKKKITIHYKSVVCVDCLFSPCVASVRTSVNASYSCQSAPPGVCCSVRLAVCQDWPTHWPDLAALDSLPAGWQVIHSVDSTNGPGLDPPLVLAAFTVAPHRLVHLWPCMCKHTHKQAHTYTQRRGTHKWHYRKKAVECEKMDMHTNQQKCTNCMLHVVGTYTY